MKGDFQERWSESRRRTLALILSIPESALSFKPLPAYRSIHELLVHIVTTETTVLTGLTSGVFDWQGETTRLSELTLPALIEAAHDADVTMSTFLESPVDLEEKVNSLTRANWLWLVYEHEIHHRGVLVLMMRLAGLEVIPIYS